MATAREIFQALNEKAGFQADNENWTKDTFTWKDIAPGKVWIYFQTGTGEECDIPNFGFHYENIDKTELYNLRVELGNIIGEAPEESEGCWVFSYVEDIEDRSVGWALKAIQELERRILFEFSN
jgi:hypothetical protein